MDILLDIGGTKTRVAATSDGKTFSEPIIIDTAQLYEEGKNDLIDVARRVSNHGPVEGIFGGIKGVVSEDGQTPLTAPLMLDWKDKQLGADLKAALGASSARFVNDTALVGLGEAIYGGGKGIDMVAYLTVSTGVNGARIMSGAIDRTHIGFEIGGQYLSMNEPAQSLEDLVSGVAISRRFGMHPKELGKEHPVWEELARVLAFGVHNTIVHWSPDIVVIGGSMMNEIGIPVPRVAEHVAHIMRKFPSVPPIVHSELGDIGGLWGALALLTVHR